MNRNVASDANGIVFGLLWNNGEPETLDPVGDGDCLDAAVGRAEVPVGTCTGCSTLLPLVPYVSPWQGWGGGSLGETNVVKSVECYLHHPSRYGL